VEELDFEPVCVAQRLHGRAREESLVRDGASLGLLSGVESGFGFKFGFGAEPGFVLAGDAPVSISASRLRLGREKGLLRVCGSAARAPQLFFEV
jgi:hypothetical protein